MHEQHPGIWLTASRSQRLFVIFKFQHEEKSLELSPFPYLHLAGAYVAAVQITTISQTKRFAYVPPYSGCIFACTINSFRRHHYQIVRECLAGIYYAENKIPGDELSLMMLWNDVDTGITEVYFLILCQLVITFCKKSSCRH